MTDGLPISRPYNLNRLGQAGDEMAFTTTEEERAALARFTEVPRIESFAGRVELKKLSSTRFRLAFTLEADIAQSCVVTLVDVPAHIALRFMRELHFSAPLRRTADLPAAADIPLDDDLPEEIDSLHYDLAAPLVEEFVLALDPYPRAPGVEFEPRIEGEEAPENPFAVLKGLKSGL
jgi:uncharacterized metal-binding protein YceD (DUF177 family)